MRSLRRGVEETRTRQLSRTECVGVRRIGARSAADEPYAQGDVSRDTSAVVEAALDTAASKYTEEAAFVKPIRRFFPRIGQNVALANAVRPKPSSTIPDMRCTQASARVSIRERRRLTPPLRISHQSAEPRPTPATSAPDDR